MEVNNKSQKWSSSEEFKTWDNFFGFYQIKLIEPATELHAKYLIFQIRWQYGMFQ